MQFKKGDRVVVVSAGPENAGTVGKKGVVFYELSDWSEGLVTVKGIDGRVTEAVRGYRSYSPDQLRRA